MFHISETKTHGQNLELSGKVFFSALFVTREFNVFLKHMYFPPPYLVSNLFCEFLRYVEGS